MRPRAAPQILIAFGNWLFAGAGKAVTLAGIASVLIGLAEVTAAWLVGMIIDRITLVGRAAFLEGYVWQLVGMVGFMLVLRLGVVLFLASITALAFNPSLSVLSLFRLHKYLLGQSLSFIEDDFGRGNLAVLLGLRAGYPARFCSAPAWLQGRRRVWHL